MYTVIKNCRICSSDKLVHVLSLGEQALTGVFPKKGEDAPVGALDVLWCSDCGLLQMKQSYNPDEMYGNNYGYRSGLNQTMINHLTEKIHGLEKVADLKPCDMVIDIGSNDATSLKAYRTKCTKVGIDPTGIKFKEYYTDDIKLIPDFFSAEKFMDEFAWRKAKIITSIAMFYDLEYPKYFVRDIKHILDDNGIWHFEQSYMPSMLRATSYDMVCHEHLEFYSFTVVKNLLEGNGMRVVDVMTNGINGGSFAVTACKKEAAYKSNTPVINWMLAHEQFLKLNTIEPYIEFEKNVYKHRTELVGLLKALIDDGKVIFGYGASTKGNVMLQFCGITNKMIPYIADVNADKFGCHTPGTNIEIISDTEAFRMDPDYLLVLPWAFKQNILEKETEYRKRGGKFIFPLPEIEIV
jgi:hypothetical protein